MTKNVMQKMRSWDENIGKLIVFAVTIIIAVGVLGTLAYFYNQSRTNSTAMAVLTSTTTSVADLKGAGFCDSNSTTGSVSYTPITNKYTLDCGAWKVTSSVATVKGITTDTSCDPTTDATCTYHVNQ